MSHLTQESPADAILVIDALARNYATARAHLGSAVRDLELALAKVRAEHLPKIKKLAATAADRQAELTAQVDTHPCLFVKPRTMTLHGIKVGFQKGKGRIEWDDEEKVIAKIRALVPLLSISEDALIVTTEKLRKDGLELLRADELKKLGVRVVDAADAVLIKASDSEVDKLVSRLLEEGRKGEEV